MTKEISVGGIIFYIQKNKIFYLLLKYPSLTKEKKVYWGFAKGRKEKGEKEMETLKREIKEETGLEKIEIIPGFKRESSYVFRRDKKLISKKVIFYLVRAREKKVSLSFEHQDFKWLPFKQAYQYLPFQDSKEILSEADQFLRKTIIQRPSLKSPQTVGGTG